GADWRPSKRGYPKIGSLPFLKTFRRLRENISFFSLKRRNVFLSDFLVLLLEKKFRFQRR
ncbi:hypothetical protein, partial [Phocaeicola coprophilus]|uniref:hypothetical protein n=1 Tax=Phocaeicola coprophilus TaxID=387090 RepID=UPI0030782578